MSDQTAATPPTIGEPLRGPILQKIHSSTASSIDDLVSELYLELQRYFFEGEDVQGLIVDDEVWLDGKVREKREWQPRFRNDGSVEQPGFTFYSITLTETRRNVRVSSNLEIRRISPPTRQDLQVFINNSAHISSRWIVDKQLVSQYNL